MSARPVAVIDHLVYGVPDLDEGIRVLADRVGVTAMRGGRHVGFGTHNALIDLGGRRYLELLALDPTQTERAGFAILLETLTMPAIVGWCASTDDLDATNGVLESLGIAATTMHVGRTRPDGVEFRGRILFPDLSEHGGLVPFFIERRRGDHPSVSAPTGASLVALRLRSPDAARLSDALGALNVEGAVVELDSAPAIRAELGTRRGVVTL